MKNISIKQVARIAARYDLDIRDPLVIASTHQADALHGQTVANFDGDRKKFWGAGWDGKYDVERLLDGYLCEQTRCMRADGLAADDFDRNAY